MSEAFGRKAVLRSVLIVTGSTYVTYTCGLLVSTLIARSLGPADYGRYSYLVWLSGLLILFFTNGLTTSGIRFVSELIGFGTPAAARNVHGWLRKGYYASLLLGSAIFLACLPFLRPAGWSGSLRTFAAIVLVSAIAKASYLFRSSIAKGYGVFGVEATTTNLMSVAGLLGTALLAFEAASLDAFLVLFAAISIGHAVLTHWLMQRTGIRPATEGLERGLATRVRQHLGWTVVLTVVAAFSNKTLETFLLNRWADSEAVGFFLIGAALTRGGIDLLSSGLTSVLMPAMGHAYGAGGMERVNRILADAVRYFGFLGLLLAGVGVLWAGPVITLLYGPRYEPAAFALRAMLVVGGLSLAESSFGTLLSTTDKQNLRAGAAVLYVVVTAIAAFALVPAYGLSGAVWAHVISHLGVTTVISVGVTLMFGLRLPYAEILRLVAAACCGAAAALLILLVSTDLIAQVIAGGVYALTYIAASVALRAWHQRDLEMVGMLTSRIPLLQGVPRRLTRWMRPSASPEAASDRDPG